MTGIAAAGHPTRAYSYVRFSTPDQAKGRSYERQIEAAKAYAEEQGLELAEFTFKDLGVSAFRGKNAQTGALRAFLKAVEDDEIPSGSYLLVESLDRITRNSIIEPQALFMLIIRAGIILVTLLDRRKYLLESINANPTDLIISIVMMMQGHEESATKSRRVADAYVRKRSEAANGEKSKPFTRMLPAWIRWNDKERKHELIPDRAKVLHNIFEKADCGFGQHAIARWLNEQGIATWGGVGRQRKAEHWHRSYIAKLLTNSAVVGTFTPHQRLTDAVGKRKRKPLDPIEHYWPAAVDRELFERVANRTLATAPRGRNALNTPASIFAGMLKCARCGGSVVRVSKGKYVYLICSEAHRKTGGCIYLAVPYSVVEGAMRRNAGPIFKYAPRGREVGNLDKQIERDDELLSVLANEAERLADELAIRPSEVVRQSLEVRERELEGARERLRALRRRQETLSRPYVLKRLTTVRDTLRAKPFKVAEVNRALKEAVSKIVINPEVGSLTIHWRHADEPQEGPPFSIRPFATVE